MHGPIRIFWANLTLFSLKVAVQQLVLALLPLCYLNFGPCPPRAPRACLVFLLWALNDPF
jgi:hypothetical protein